ncbi:short-chain collagen C4-like [Saccoglossus kowalevskii]
MSPYPVLFDTSTRYDLLNDDIFLFMCCNVSKSTFKYMQLCVLLIDESLAMKSQSSIYEQRTSSVDAPGTLYIRWGRTTCPSTAELVYEGVIGGEDFDIDGGGSNFQCLPLDPIWDNPMGGTDTYRGRMYGTEYSTHTFVPFSDLHHHDAVCAVCLVKSRSRLLMIPARNVCPSEWTREYYGYLMTSRHTHLRTEFICVDRNAESRYGSSANVNGVLIYAVEGVCGSLPCDPYIEGHELTCAVCTI